MKKINGEITLFHYDLQVIKHVILSQTNGEIAAILKISINRIKKILSKLYGYSLFPERGDLIQWAFSIGFSRVYGSSEVYFKGELL